MFKVKKIRIALLLPAAVILGSFFAIRPTVTAASSPRIVFSSDRDGNSEVYIMNSDGTGQTNLTNNPASDWGAAWSPDGTKISFASDRSGNYDIYTMNPDGSNVTNITNSPENEGPPIWSPDGTKMISVRQSGSDYRILLMKSDGTDQFAFPAYTEPYGLNDFSPDSQKVVGSFPNSGYFQLVTANSDLSNAAPITSGNYRHGFPRFSPSGDKIAYFRNDGSSSATELFVSNVDGTNQTSIATVSPDTSMMNLPYWSPDGTRIIYTGNNDGNWDLYTVSSSGGSSTNITNNNADNNGYWSLDGSKVLLETNKDGNYELYIMSPDGSGMVNLTNSSAADRIYISAFEPLSGPDNNGGGTTDPDPTPAAPRTGKLIGATIATVAIISMVLILAKEIKQKHHTWGGEK